MNTLLIVSSEKERTDEVRKHNQCSPPGSRVVQRDSMCELGLPITRPQLYQCLRCNTGGPSEQNPDPRRPLSPRACQPSRRADRFRGCLSSLSSWVKWLWRPFLFFGLRAADSKDRRRMFVVVWQEPLRPDVIHDR